MSENGPIRVAQIMGKMNNGGVESVVMNYYRHIDRSKVQFDFFVDEDSTAIPREEIENAGGRLYIIPPYQRLHRYLPALVRLFRENRYRIVHAHINTLSVFPLFAAKLAGVPVRVAHSHSTAAKGETKKNILKYTLRPFSRVFATDYAACSRYSGEWLFGKRAMERGDVTVFNNAIDLDRFRYDEAVRSQVRGELGLEGKFVIGHVGRFCFQKNQEFLIDIYREVYKEEPNAVLLLIGGGEDRAKIEEKVNAITEGKVFLLGNRADVDRLYQAMDVFVLPSRYEGLPVVGVEAQAAGLPCVFSDAVTKDVCLTPTAGFCRCEEPTRAWAESILRLAGTERSGGEDALRQKGFDIRLQGRCLTEYYMALLDAAER